MSDFVDFGETKWSPSAKSPPPTTVLAVERSESLAEKLKKKKRYQTVMSKDYGELNLGQTGLLGVS